MWICRKLKSVLILQQRSTHGRNSQITATKGDQEAKKQPAFLSDLILFQAWLALTFLILPVGEFTKEGQGIIVKKTESCILSALRCGTVIQAPSHKVGLRRAAILPFLEGRWLCKGQAFAVHKNVLPAA